MFKITNIDGAYIGSTESLGYIRVGSSGDYILTDLDHATGIAYCGTPYNLFGYDEIPDTDTVILSEFDGGEQIAELQDTIDDIVVSMLSGGDSIV